MQPHQNDLQTHTYSPLEPYRARIVTTSDSTTVPTINKEEKRSSVIRGETATASGAKLTARAQSMSALLGFTTVCLVRVKFY